MITYGPFEELLSALRLRGFDEEARELNEILHETAWTTASEFIGELGAQVRKIEKKRGSALSKDVLEKIEECFKVVTEVYPTFPR